ncbi:MAG TPA: sn-glycerol-3-phosphate ABC transporter ATP-binding protein UgpC [Candidatus Methylomirabilis sp.]|nr:sn-glycerol-3-phosphate ABC transporter ATP-binding protein UgpC [Candidatus Methylomirabilis sp.]
MATVYLESLTKRFDEVVAVESVNLEIQDQEFVVLVGPSGCGKSTTLRMIAGLEEITGGKIFIGGRLVNDVPPKDRDIAMVFQNYALYPHMSVYDNMAFGLKLRKFPRQEIEQRVREAAEILGIQELLQRKPKALSGGQRQRVAVGRAIVRKPQVFLFDEPLSNLDAKLRVQMRVELKKLHQRLHATIVYVTHDQVEAMTMGDRIVEMRDGRIHQVGPPLQVYEQPVNRFVAGFIGSPAMNFVPVTVQAADGRLTLVANGFRVPVPAARAAALQRFAGRTLTFGIRPEDIAAAGATDGRPTFEAVVEVVEPLGAEILLNMRAGTDALTARVEPSLAVRAQDRIRLALAEDKMHFFDPESEQVIR